MGVYRVRPEDELDSPEALGDFAKVNMVLVAWEAGELSEGQACALVGVDPVTIRGMRQGAIAAAHLMWTEHRRTNQAGIGDR